MSDAQLTYVLDRDGPAKSGELVEALARVLVDIHRQKDTNTSVSQAADDVGVSISLPQTER